MSNYSSIGRATAEAMQNNINLAWRHGDPHRYCASVMANGRTCGRLAKGVLRFNAPACGIHLRASDLRGDERP